MVDPVPVSQEPHTYLTLATEVTKRYPDQIKELSRLYRRWVPNQAAIEELHQTVCPLIAMVADDLKMLTTEWRMDETLNACVNSHRSIYGG